MLECITPVILTRNEAPNIGPTLARHTWARDIVLVDSLSTDATLEIARAYPAVRVYRRRFDSHPEQWNFAATQTGIATDWILALDADYVLSDELVEELRLLVPEGSRNNNSPFRNADPSRLAALRKGLHTMSMRPFPRLARRAPQRPKMGSYYFASPESEMNGFRASFAFCVLGVELRGALYPPVTVLFHRGSVRYVQDGHTQRLSLTGAVGSLQARIVHDDRKSLSDWLWAQDRYMSVEADKIHAAGWQGLGSVDRMRSLILLAPPLVFLYCLFVKRGILDGWPGLYYALLRAIAESILALKLIERRSRQWRR